jgi:hypothetical protein
VGICIDKDVAVDVRRRFELIRQRDEAARALPMKAELEGQIQSPPSLFRAAARDLQATRPINAKGG